jgi:hypothetical protein
MDTGIPDYLLIETPRLEFCLTLIFVLTFKFLIETKRRFCLRSPEGTFQLREGPALTSQGLTPNHVTKLTLPSRAPILVLPPKEKPSWKIPLY